MLLFALAILAFGCFLRVQPRQEDHEFIERLEDTGLDLPTPHEMRHVIAVPDDKRDITEAVLEDDGYVTNSARVATGRWEITASRREIITARSVFDARREMSRLMDDLGGEYVSLEVRE